MKHKSREVRQQLLCLLADGDFDDDFDMDDKPKKKTQAFGAGDDDDFDDFDSPPKKKASPQKA